MRKSLPALALVLAIAFTAALRADEPDNKPVQATIGETQITIPAPEGFVNIKQGVPELLKLVQSLVPDTNTLIAGFIEPETAKAKAEDAVLNKYMMVQYASAIANTKIGDDDFKDIKTEVSKQNVGDMKEDINATLKKVTDGKVEVGKPVMLNTFIDEPNASAFGMIAKYGATDDKEKEQTVVGGCSFVHVKDKVVFLYVYTVYDGQKSVDWMQKTTKAWTDAVLKANK